MCCFTPVITFCSYSHNYFLLSNCFSPLSCHLNPFFCPQIGENNHFNFSLGNHFLFSFCFSFVCFVFFACRLFCLIGVNLGAVVMTFEVNELLLTITHSLAHARTHTCASERTLTRALKQACICSVHRCKPANKHIHASTHTQRHAHTHAHADRPYKICKHWYYGKKAVTSDSWSLLTASFWVLDLKSKAHLEEKTAN